MTTGLFIGRLNPPHIGHIKIIEKALLENDKVLLLLGSTEESDDRNYLSFEKRKELLNIKYADEKKLEVIEIMDDESDLNWALKICKLLFEYGDGNKKIKFYGGDFDNDSAYEVISEYENYFIDFYIRYIEVNRKNSFIDHDGEKYEISATNLRKALKEKNFYLASKFCDKDMFQEIKKSFK